MAAVIRWASLVVWMTSALAWGTPAKTGDGAADPGPPGFPEEVSSCAECHREIYDEWKGSMHHGSWTSSIVQERMTRLKKDEESCAGCHAARLEFDGKGGISRKARQGGRELGVSCRTCHCTADCVLLGPRDRRLARSGPKPSSIFAEMKAEALCRTCHQSPQKSFDARPAAMQDKSCVDCHMPMVAKAQAPGPDGPAETRRRHTFYGSYVQEFVAGALRVTIDPGGAVSVANEGAGHAIPFAPVKTLFVTMSALDESGKALGTEKTEIRHKNPIMPGAAWSGQAPMPNGTASIHVKLTYRFADLQPESEHMTIARVGRTVR